MKTEIANLLALAEQESALARAETDFLKRSHHEEFATRYSAQAHLLSQAPEEVNAWSLKNWLRCATRSVELHGLKLLKHSR